MPEKSPTLVAYEKLPPGPERNAFRIQAHDFLAKEVLEFRPQSANTLASALVPDYLSDALVTVLGTELAPINSFARNVGTNPAAPKRGVEVGKATVGATGQTNATNFESGDSTLEAQAVTVNLYSQSFHITHAQANQGFSLAQLAEINAQTFANQLSDVWTAVLTSGNYGTLAIGAAASFDSGDMPAIFATAKNYQQRNLILDGQHLAYLLPTDRQKFQFGDVGAYGFDRIAMQNRWTGIATNGSGFVCGPSALLIASGMPAAMPPSEFLSLGAVTLPRIGVAIQYSSWFARATRTTWASYQVMFGAAPGDTTQGKALVTS